MKYQDLKKQSKEELDKLLQTTRETLRAENFKDKFSKKASTIREAKRTIAQTLTELSARHKEETK